MSSLLLALLLCAQDKPLARLPETATEIAVNADASAVAWIEEGKKVVCGGIAGAEFDEVRHLRVDDEGVVAYAARSGGAWTIIWGKTKSKPFDEVTPPLLEADSLAFTGRRGQSWTAVMDHMEGPPLDAISCLALRRDGLQLAYAGRRGDKTRLILGELRGPEFEKITAIVFTNDGSRLAYAVAEGKDAWFIEGPVVPDSATIALYRRTPDGKTQASAGLYDMTDRDAALNILKQWKEDELALSLEVDAEVPWTDVRPQLLLCKEAGHHRVTFGPPSSRKPFETFDSIDALAGFAAGNRIGVLGSQQGLKRVFMSGWQSSEYEALGGLTAGPRKILAYRAKRGESWSAVLGQRGKPGDPYKAVGDPVVSPDEKAISYAAFDGKSWFIVAGEKKSDAYDQVWRPRFGPEEGQVVFAARKGREITRVVLSLK